MDRTVTQIRTRKVLLEDNYPVCGVVVTTEVQARVTAHEAGNYARWLDYVNGLLTKAGFPMLGFEDERARA